MAQEREYLDTSLLSFLLSPSSHQIPIPPLLPRPLSLSSTPTSSLPPVPSSSSITTPPPSAPIPSVSSQRIGHRDLVAIGFQAGFSLPFPRGPSTPSSSSPGTRPPRHPSACPPSPIPSSPPRPRPQAAAAVLTQRGLRRSGLAVVAATSHPLSRNPLWIRGPCAPSAGLSLSAPGWDQVAASARLSSARLSPLPAPDRTSEAEAG